jgi:hypothetical protein
MKPVGNLELTLYFYVSLVEIWIAVYIKYLLIDPHKKCVDALVNQYFEKLNQNEETINKIWHDTHLMIGTLQYCSGSPDIPPSRTLHKLL